MRDAELSLVLSDRRKTKDELTTEFIFSDPACRYILTESRDMVYDHFNVSDGIATVGGWKIGDKLYFSVSFCAPEDNFSRKLGRDIVAGSLCCSDSRRRAVIDISKVNDEAPPIVLLYALTEYLKRGKGIPQWAKNSVVSFRTRRSGAGL